MASKEVVLFTLLVASALASTTINGANLTVNGQEIRDATCTLSGAGLFASLAVVTAVADQKPALDACAPNGAAARVSWDWTSGATQNATVVRSADAAVGSCIATALSNVQPGALQGHCEATLLVGDPTAAGAAADALVQPEAATITPEAK